MEASDSSVVARVSNPCGMLGGGELRYGSRTRHGLKTGLKTRATRTPLPACESAQIDFGADGY